MKTSKATIAALAVLVSGVLACESAFAWGRGRGFYGAPFVAGALVGGVLIAGSRYYYPPYPYYPPYYAPYSPYSYYPPAPTVYVEQGAQPQTQQQNQQGFWYYCADSRTYYPYVKECPAGWQRVAPQPG